MYLGTANKQAGAKSELGKYDEERVIGLYITKRPAFGIRASSWSSVISARARVNASAGQGVRSGRVKIGGW